jgi:hypothetical protein
VVRLGRAAIQHEGVSGELTRGQHAELLNRVTAGVLESQPLYATDVAVSLQATTSSCKQDCQGRGVCNLEIVLTSPGSQSMARYSSPTVVIEGSHVVPPRD